MNRDRDLFPRNVVVTLFYDENLNVFVEDRSKKSKAGELYGLFGGGIEEGETPKQALYRELEEELNYKPKKLVYWGKYSFTIDLPGSEYDGEERFGELYLSPITRELKDKNEYKTFGKLLPLDRILENKNHEFGPVKFSNFEQLKSDLTELVKGRSQTI